MTISAHLPVAFHHGLVELFIQQDLGDIFLLVITLFLQELNHVMEGQVNAIEHMVAEEKDIIESDSSLQEKQTSDQ